MIYDKIENIEKYFTVDGMKEMVKGQFIKGKFDIATNYFGIGLEYNTRDRNQCLWEAHRKIVDIHIIIEGEELIDVSDIDNMTTSKVYVNLDDYELFTGELEHTLKLRKGYFLALFPHDVHRTSIMIDNEIAVKKYVLKYAY